MKPLAKYKEVVKEFGIPDEHNVSPVGKMTYIQEQVGQQKAILNRLLFDLTVSEVHKEQAKDKMSQDAHRKKADEYRNDLYQIHAALKINIQLIDELRAEYPELAIEE